MITAQARAEWSQGASSNLRSELIHLDGYGVQVPTTDQIRSEPLRLDGHGVQVRIGVELGAQVRKSVDRVGKVDLELCITSTVGEAAGAL